MCISYVYILYHHISWTVCSHLEQLGRYGRGMLGHCARDAHCVLCINYAWTHECVVSSSYMFIHNMGV